MECVHVLCKALGGGGTRLICKANATRRRIYYETLTVESVHTLSTAFVRSTPTDQNLSVITHLQRVYYFLPLRFFVVSVSHSIAW